MFSILLESFCEIILIAECGKNSHEAKYRNVRTLL